jgi:hypothetical protein
VSAKFAPRRSPPRGAYAQPGRFGRGSSVPRSYWSRFPPAGDGAVFRARRPAPGGTVLVDVSGSMNLSQEDLETIVAAAPAATVAVYASTDRAFRRGAVTIVARGGRVADIRSVHRGYTEGNVVDGPALEWLGRQPEPRLWISDGVVTGVGDITTPRLLLEAATLCRRFRIRRVEPVWEGGRLVVPFGEGGV